MALLSKASDGVQYLQIFVLCYWLYSKVPFDSCLTDRNQLHDVVNKSKFVRVVLQI